MSTTIHTVTTQESPENKKTELSYEAFKPAENSMPSMDDFIKYSTPENLLGEISLSIYPPTVLNPNCRGRFYNNVLNTRSEFNIRPYKAVDFYLPNVCTRGVKTTTRFDGNGEEFDMHNMYLSITNDQYKTVKAIYAWAYDETQQALTKPQFASIDPKVYRSSIVGAVEKTEDEVKVIEINIAPVEQKTYCYKKGVPFSDSAKCISTLLLEETLNRVDAIINPYLKINNKGYWALTYRLVALNYIRTVNKADDATVSHSKSSLMQYMK